MENYNRILGLVEEVRGILDLHEAKKKPKSVTTKHIMKGFKKPTYQNPFSRLKKGKSLGPGPQGSTSVPGKQRKYWSCRCRHYKCVCKGSEGEKKIVRIKPGYKDKYNKLYRKHRKIHANVYKGGKGSKFTKPKKKGWTGVTKGKKKKKG